MSVSLPKVKIGFLGEESIYSKELLLRFRLYEEHGAVEVKYFNPQDLTLQGIIDENLKALIVDMNFDCVNYDRLFQEVKNCFYPENLFIFGFSSKLDEEEIQRIQKLGLHFVYHRMGQGSDETKFLVQSVIKCLFPGNKIVNNFAVARINKDSLVQSPVNIKKISTSEITLQGNFRPFEKEIVSLKHEFLKKLNWRDSQLAVLNVEECPQNILNWQTTLKSDLLRIEDVERFEGDYASNLVEGVLDANHKKQEYRQFLKILFQEKKTNLINFYRRFRFDCDPNVRTPVLLISQHYLNFRIKGEELLDKYALYKKNLLTPSLGIIKKINPQVIFFELEQVPAEFTEKTLFKFNDKETLRFLIHKLNEEKINTTIIVFCPEEEILKELSNLPSFVKLLPFTLCEKFITAFLKDKIPVVKETSQLKFKNNEAPDPVLWLSERNGVNFALVEVSAKLEALSELEVLVETKAELPEYTLLKAVYPIPFYLTIMPDRTKAQTGTLRRYRAIINGLTSEQRDELRGFVITFNADQGSGAA